MSEVSIGFATLDKSASSSERNSRVGSTARPFTACSHRLVDTVSVVLVCPAHRKLALAPLSSHPSGNLWFPVCEFTATECYDEAAARLLEQILKSGRPCYTDLQLMHTLWLEVPKCGEFVTRILFYTELDEAAQKSAVCPCSSSIGSAMWYAFSDIANLPNLHGPEPGMVASHLDKNDKGMPQVDTSGFVEMSIQKLIDFITSEPNAKLYSGAGVSPEDAVQVYIDYAQMCFPSHFMNLKLLGDYLAHVLPDATNLDLNGLMIACDLTRVKMHLDFFEFIAGLAALDPSTPHGDYCGLVRIGYIFRFFDKVRGDGLSSKELTAFARDLLRFRSNQDGNVEPSDAKVAKLVDTLYRCFNVPAKQHISSSVFARTIASMNHPELRGTSQLFRSDVSAINQICTKPMFPRLQVKPNAKSTCARCRSKKYTLASHTVTMLSDRVVVEPIYIGQTEYCSDAIRMPLAEKLHSTIVFSQDFLANQLLDTIHDFAENPQEWNNATKRLELVPRIQQMCAEVAKTLANEARMVRLQSPCYVLGDIHGSLEDLMAYEQLFWPMSAACYTANYLFLGNFIKPGAQSIECAVYLLCAKLLAPKRFHLLRGNNELRHVQRSKAEKGDNSFYSECTAKFGPESGAAVWEALNKAFDCLPLAALVDEQLFCVHGGIPSAVDKLAELDTTIPCPLKNPMTDCKVAWELLQNEPIIADEFEKEKQRTGDQNKSTLPRGFLPSCRHSTGLYFSDEAVDAFLTANGLSHIIISGHDGLADGFDALFGGKLVALFSSSRYPDSEAAILQIGLDNKIRPIKVAKK